VGLIKTKMKKSKDIHYQFWLLMIPYYCDKWSKGVSYDDLMDGYKSNQTNKDE
jgi:hypothetical protein